MCLGLANGYIEEKGNEIRDGDEFKLVTKKRCLFVSSKVDTEQNCSCSAFKSRTHRCSARKRNEKIRFQKTLITISIYILYIAKI